MSSALSFLEILEQAYQKQKQRFRTNPHRYQCVSTVRQKQKQRNQSRTKSKSRKKQSKTNNLHSRRSLRIMSDENNEVDYVELEKQPLWQPKRKKKKEINKISINPLLRKTGPKREQVDELYQFYSPDINRKPEEEKLNLQNRPQIEPDRHNLSYEAKVNVKNTEMVEASEGHSQSEDRLAEWKPSKQQLSQLAIQVIIDEYILFKSNMRGSEQARIAELVNYIREIKGYYFNMAVLHSILAGNPQLYQLLTLGTEKYLKCLVKLTPDAIKRRVKATKKKMYSSSCKTAN